MSNLLPTEPEMVFSFPLGSPDRVEVWQIPRERFGLTELFYQLRVFVKNSQRYTFDLPDDVEKIGGYL